MALSTGPTTIERTLAGRQEAARAPAARDAASLAASGQEIGLAIGHYLVWLGREAASLGAPRVHFLSREGAWLADHYARLRQSHPQGRSWPEPVALAVSRRSTLLPSLPRVDAGTLTPLLAQYGGISAATLLDSLGLRLPPPGARPGPAMGLPLDRPWAEADAARRVLDDGWIAVELEARRLAQRDALLRYLAQEKAMEAEPLVVADVGWRGTIQDNLARLMPDRRVTGLYLALFPPLSPAPENAEKRGLILDPSSPQRLARRLRFVAPLEFAASSEAPTTLEYGLDGSEARPVLDTLSVVPAASPGFRLFQQALAAGVDRASGLLEPNHAVARRHVLRVLESPPRSLVDLFFEAWRDDRYGAGSLRRGAPRLRPLRVLAAVADRARRRALGLELAESGWPWGVLARDMPRAAPLLRRLILGVDARL